LKPSIIAIDGPASSGKTTVGERLAERLSYTFFDTGAMYRAITWVALDRHVPIAHESPITRLAEQVVIDIGPALVDDGRPYTVLADGQDITWQIRRPEVDRNVSAVSAYPGVRKALTEQQRRIALRGRIVVVGRDIGTVVAPDADLKLYLDASAEERARRRTQEREARGEPVDYDRVLADVLRRDEIDSSRAAAPLRPADTAIIVDTTQLTVEQVLDRVLRLTDEWEQTHCPRADETAPQDSATAGHPD
jgi:cytidylate kinase